MVSYPMVIGVSIIGVLFFSVIVFGATGSVSSVFVVFTMAAILGYVLYQLGYINVSSDSSGLDIQFHERAPTPAPTAPASCSPAATR